MNNEIVAKAIIAIAFGITGAIFITPIFIFLRKIIYGPTINKRLFEQAKEKGNVVVAKLIKHYDQYNHNGAYKNVSGKEIGIYEYEVNDRKYKYRFITINGLHKEITLYYIKNPRKASVPKEMFITQSSPWIVSFLLIGFICWLIAFLCLINMNI